MRLKPEIILIHGYTGGPTDFSDLPDALMRALPAETWCPLLPGHGTSVDDLLPLSSTDMFDGVEKRIVDTLAADRPVVLLGLSFGAQAALYFASRHPIAGAVAINATHGLKLPWSLPGIGLLARIRPAWAKNFSPEERAERAGAILYETVPTRSLFLSRELRRKVDVGARAISCPVFFIHSTDERFGNWRAVDRLRRKIPAPTRLSLVRSRGHSLFFSEAKQQATEEIVAFLKSLDIFARMQSPSRDTRVTAIVPAYNESAHIEAVLSALTRAPSVGEIIVVDDGSTDDTGIRSGNVPGVTVLRNAANLGKAESMERAARAARFDVLFFCDADLVGFGPEHVEAIIRPVVTGQYDMFIGIRGNLMQTAFHAIALNSGERALRKEVWFGLPDYFKHRYRIEAGLNHYVKQTGAKGFGWKQFDYTHRIKEAKYGVLRGTGLRWWMNFDVVSAYLRYPIMGRLSRRRVAERIELPERAPPPTPPPHQSA
jgi:pimeloyl-ACP methyl ester carboxylesterase